MCKAVEPPVRMPSADQHLPACAIDLEKRKPVFNNIFAGLSGPAVRPIALRMVWQAVGAVNIPVVGLGGIATGRDALEFIMQVPRRCRWARQTLPTPAPWRPLPMRWHSGWMPTA